MIKKLLGGYVEKDENYPEGIYTLDNVILNGWKQWLTIRGQNKANPILLFVHGGPGSPQTGAQIKFNRELEAHFTIVNWDQRGGGKSFTPNMNPKLLNLEILLSDLHELVNYLCHHYKQEQIFLMGHSIGAVISLLYISKHPEQIAAYIGVNQPTHRQLEEKRSYEFVMDYAKKRNIKKALRDMEEIGEPINGLYKDENGLVKQRTWLTKFNGVSTSRKAQSINMQYFLSTHLTLKEKLNFMKGFAFSYRQLWKDATALNFFQTVAEVTVPIYFIHGKNDKIVFLDTLEEYFASLKAPAKKLFVLENAGHYCLFEENIKFNNILIEILSDSKR